MSRLNQNKHKLLKVIELYYFEILIKIFYRLEYYLNLIYLYNIILFIKILVILNLLYLIE